MVKKIKVAILMGGYSSERKISISTGKQIYENLDRNKYEVYAMDAALIEGSPRKIEKPLDVQIESVEKANKWVAENNILEPMQKLITDRPDVAFIALHGKFGEDGTIQGYLDLLGIPYTGSGVLASSLAMNKSMAKKVLKSNKILVPVSVDLLYNSSRESFKQVILTVSEYGYPVYVKASKQGSSIGVIKVSSKDELLPAIKEAGAYDNEIIVEKSIEGTELTVSCLGNEKPIALPVIEIVPKSGSYDWKSKYDEGATQEIVPARISAQDTLKAQQIAMKAHKTLGCRGMSRTDIILAEDGMYVLEVNTIPGMTPTSLMPTAAKAAGIGFSELLDKIIEFALEG